jgi:hypothetical protein
MARESEIAAVDWMVVNLVSDTQWAKARGALVGVPGRSNKNTSFEDPTAAVRSWLKEEDQERFRFSSWEGLHAKVIKGEPKLAAVDAYLRGKSAYLKPAFNLS